MKNTLRKIFTLCLVVFGYCIELTAQQGAETELEEICERFARPQNRGDDLDESVEYSLEDVMGEKAKVNASAIAETAEEAAEEAAAEAAFKSVAVEDVELTMGELLLEEAELTFSLLSGEIIPMAIGLVSFDQFVDLGEFVYERMRNGLNRFDTNNYAEAFFKDFIIEEGGEHKQILKKLGETLVSGVEDSFNEEDVYGSNSITYTDVNGGTLVENYDMKMGLPYLSRSELATDDMDMEEGRISTSVLIASDNSMWAYEPFGEYDIFINQEEDLEEVGLHKEARKAYNRALRILRTEMKSDTAFVMNSKNQTNSSIWKYKNPEAPDAKEYAKFDLEQNYKIGYAPLTTVVKIGPSGDGTTLHAEQSWQWKTLGGTLERKAYSDPHKNHHTKSLTLRLDDKYVEVTHISPLKAYLLKGNSDGSNFDYDNKIEVPYTWSIPEESPNGIDVAYYSINFDFDESIIDFGEDLHLGIFMDEAVVKEDANIFEGAGDPEEKVEYRHKMVYFAALTDFVEKDDTYFDAQILSSDYVDEDGNYHLERDLILEVPLPNSGIDQIRLTNLSAPQSNSPIVILDVSDVEASEYDALNGDVSDNNSVVALLANTSSSSVEKLDVSYEVYLDKYVITIEDVPFQVGDKIFMTTPFRAEGKEVRSLLEMDYGSSLEGNHTYNFYSDSDENYLVSDGTEVTLGAKRNFSRGWNLHSFPNGSVALMDHRSSQVLGMEDDGDLMMSDWGDGPVEAYQWYVYWGEDNRISLLNNLTGSYLDLDPNDEIESSNFLVEDKMKATYVDIPPGLYKVWNRFLREQVLVSRGDQLEFLSEAQNIEDGGQWFFQYVGFGQYRILNSVSGTYLDTDDDGNIKISGIDMNTNKYAGGWRIMVKENGDLMIKDPRTGLYLQTMPDEGGFTRLGTPESDDDMRFSFRFLRSDLEINNFAAFTRSWYSVDFGTFQEELLIEPVGDNGEYRIMNTSGQVLAAAQDGSISYVHFQNEEAEKWLIYHDFDQVVLFNRTVRGYYFIDDEGVPRISTSEATSINYPGFRRYQYVLDDQEYVILNESETKDYWYIGDQDDLIEGTSLARDFEDYKFQITYVGALHYYIHNHKKGLKKDDQGSDLIFGEGDSTYWEIIPVLDHNTERMYVKSEAGEYISTTVDVSSRPVLSASRASVANDNIQWRFLNIASDATHLDYLYQDAQTVDSYVKGLEYTYTHLSSGIEYSGMVGSMELPSTSYHEVVPGNFNLTFEGYLKVTAQDYYEFIIEMDGGNEARTDFDLFIDGKRIIKGNTVSMQSDRVAHFLGEDVGLEAGFHKIKLVYSNTANDFILPDDISL